MLKSWTSEEIPPKAELKERLSKSKNRLYWSFLKDGVLQAKEV